LRAADLRLVVLDSSVVIKWLRDGESLRAQALALRASYLDGSLDIAVPDLLIYEVANVLRYKTDLTSTEVVAAVQSIFDMDVAIIPIGPELAARAIALARQHDVTVYDATFVACAEHLSASLVTADAGLAGKATSPRPIIFLGDLHGPF